MAHARDTLPLELEIHAGPVDTLQVNITRLCNQACSHCHMDAGPTRSEMMPASVIDDCLRVLTNYPEFATLDITGGAPELHPEFERLVAAASALGKRVIVRHNLTVTLDPHPLTGRSMRHLPRFFARHCLEVVASLPCYLAANTDRQRGTGTHVKCIESLRALNAEGIGMPGSPLVLTLVHNPTGTGLPGDQAALEADYRRELAHHGVHFTSLIAMTNLPISRFAELLRHEELYDAYFDTLHGAFNRDAVGRVMCRSLASVGPDGRLYDCDFNQALELVADVGGPARIATFDPRRWAARRIVTGKHCLGCVAGSGSSCAGALLSA